jgi:hypothetical protein
VTATVAQNCDENFLIDATIVNRTAAAVTVGVTGTAVDSGPLFRTVTVGAGETGILRVAGTEIINQQDLVYRRVDTGEVLATFHIDFSVCLLRKDLSIRVISGRPFTSGGIACPTWSVTKTVQHGTLRLLPPGNFGFAAFTYTSNRGYVGPDPFDYICAGGDLVFGTVFITVVPAPAEPTPPATGAAPPTPPATAADLAATGAALRGELTAGVGLLLLGALLVWFSRPRRHAR